MTAPLPIVIDTDPGLDDAVGILHALACGGFDVAAMTSVAGNIGIDTTTRNIGRLLTAMDRAEVPHAAGAAGPLAGDALNEVAIHGDDGLGGVALPAPRATPDPRGAVALLQATLEAAPEGTLSVLALGPLTNLALLLRSAPEAYARIGRIIAMGGAIEERGNVGPYAEFNIACDPLAAAEVFAGPVPVTLVPLDVTRRIRATEADLDRLAGLVTRAATLSAALIRAYFHGNADRASRPLHDPCVMLLALQPDLFEVAEMRLSVELSGDHPGRLTRTGTGAAVTVAMQIDAPAALDALWQGLGT